MDEKKKIFFQNSKKNCSELLSGIEAAVDGLTYLSETDAPFLAYAGPAAADASYETILQQAGPVLDTPIKEIDLDAFFSKLTSLRDWFDESHKLRAKKFLELRKLLEENLCGLRAFRLGEIRVHYYIVGLSADGHLIGVITSAVET